MKKSRKLHVVSGLIILIGILVIADGIGSILLPGNNHDFIYDFEREIRVVAGFLIAILGIYLEASTYQSPLALRSCSPLDLLTINIGF